MRWNASLAACHSSPARTSGNASQTTAWCRRRPAPDSLAASDPCRTVAQTRIRASTVRTVGPPGEAALGRSTTRARSSCASASKGLYSDARSRRCSSALTEAFGKRPSNSSASLASVVRSMPTVLTAASSRSTQATAKARVDRPLSRAAFIAASFSAANAASWSIAADRSFCALPDPSGCVRHDPSAVAAPVRRRGLRQSRAVDRAQG